MTAEYFKFRYNTKSNGVNKASRPADMSVMGNSVMIKKSEVFENEQSNSYRSSPYQAQNFAFA